MPSNARTERALVEPNHDGTVNVKYEPRQSGDHYLSVTRDGKNVQPPIHFWVDDSVGATVYGPGLQNGVVGEPCAFTVCAKGCSAKQLSIDVEGTSKTPIQIHDNKDGTCSITYVPSVPGEYKVHVKLGGEPVASSPFSVIVAGEGQKRSHLSVGSTSEVALNIRGDIKGISASIKSPSGIEEPCFVRMLGEGKLGVSFTPREVGEHLVTVKRDGNLLPKAPYRINVDKSQVGDANKVEVSGEGKSKAVTMQHNKLLIDTRAAGYGGLSVSVSGPSKAELTCTEVNPGLVQIAYVPTEPGVYVINVKFADADVRDSPITVLCEGEGRGAVTTTAQCKVAAGTVCLAQQMAEVHLKLADMAPIDLTARILSPKGVVEDVEVRDLGEFLYVLRFRPTYEGQFALLLLHKGMHVVGSPFPFTVGRVLETTQGSHRVRATGFGLVRGETGRTQHFTVYSHEGGEGALSVAIDGPSKAAVEFTELGGCGTIGVAYKVASPGEYSIAVRFNDSHIADSPFKVFVAAGTGEARKLELGSFNDRGIPVNKAYTFQVLTHRAKGLLEAKVHGPRGDIETMDIVPMEEGETYACRFVPREAGNHYLHVTLDGAPMRDSPFRLRVGGADESDPTAISVSGEGIQKAVSGQKSEFIITTTNAGAGCLVVQIDGPSKVTLDAYELDKGYKARYTPLSPGIYYATIKYNGIHIPGSPFKIVAEGKVLGGNGYNESAIVRIDSLAKTEKGTAAQKPTFTGDASKVKVTGAGLSKYFAGRPTLFTVDTGLAGPNILYVGVVTTKGAAEEVNVRQAEQAGQYNVAYKIQQGLRVKGFVFVKYGDDDVPGSPFAIEP